jgi:hypothetical protein
MKQESAGFDQGMERGRQSAHQKTCLYLRLLKRRLRDVQPKFWLKLRLRDLRKPGEWKL